MIGFHLPAVPTELEWLHSPQDWKTGEDGSLTILAGEHTDWFVDPAGRPGKDSAACALFNPPDENFLLSCKVTVDFATTFDAGVLQLRLSEQRWAKLCFEFSPQNQPTIVSVVTRGVSDDCNSVTIGGSEVYLRMAVTVKTIGFHYSLDGSFWHFVRFFSLGEMENLRVGFSAQSPTGQQCKAVFSKINYRAGELQDYRNGG